MSQEKTEDYSRKKFKPIFFLAHHKTDYTHNSNLVHIFYNENLQYVINGLNDNIYIFIEKLKL